MAEPLRTLIVDDEPPAVRRMVRLCQAIPMLNVTATANDGAQALRALADSDIDLVLLDIELPGMSGMECAKQMATLSQPPMIIFTTAYKRFAIAAFDVDAIGYLLKPIDPILLGGAIDRAVRRRSERTPPMAAPLADQENAQVFWVPNRGSLLRIESQTVDYITGEDDYARLHCGDKSYLLAERLYGIEARLSPGRFIRIHRSALVNIDRIIALDLQSGSWSVRLTTGECVPVGRTFLGKLRATLDVPK